MYFKSAFETSTDSPAQEDICNALCAITSNNSPCHTLESTMCVCMWFEGRVWASRRNKSIRFDFQFSVTICIGCTPNVPFMACCVFNIAEIQCFRFSSSRGVPGATFRIKVITGFPLASYLQKLLLCFFMNSGAVKHFILYK